MQGVWVRFVVGELRSHMPHGMAKKKKNIYIYIYIYIYLYKIRDFLSRTNKEFLQLNSIIKYK